MGLTTNIPEIRSVLAPHEAIRTGVLFTGSGSEYFRIWIINILLTLVTLGLYLPWAKVRKLRYFYNHTDVGGYALDFHGNPRRMLRGSMLVGVFLLVYTQATRFAPFAGFAAAVAFVLVWPALMRASMQFRLTNTSWRGKRFGFKGSMGGVYAALFVPMAILLLPGAALSAFAEKSGRMTQVPPELAYLGYAFLAFMLSFPYFFWRLKSYQHSNYVYATQQSEFRSGVGSMYGLCLRTVLVTLLCLAIVLAIAFTMTGGLVAVRAFGDRPTSRGESRDLAIAAMVGLSVFYLLITLFVQTYWNSRLQNLMWSRTGNRLLRFRSRLKARKLLMVTLRNWILTVLTAGLYWPFAAVAAYRTRIEAVEVVSRVKLDQFSGGSRERNDDASGDMAADMAGLDFGI